MVDVGVRAAIEVVTGGSVAEPWVAECSARVSSVLVRHQLRDGARVRLTAVPHGGPVVMQVNLRVCGAPARIQAVGTDTADAIAAGTARLDRQLDRLTTGWEPWPWPDPDRRALNAPGGRRIHRRKTYALAVQRACQATATLNAMDYDAFLFTDADTGEDALVYRCGPAGVRLARQYTMRPPWPPTGPPLTVNPRGTLRLTISDATRQVAAGWLPFLFFTEADTGRGNLLYRRYDGGLALIAPV